MEVQYEKIFGKKTFPFNSKQDKNDIGEKLFMDKNYSIIASPENWIEQTAIDQLIKLSCLQGIVKTVAFPDLHAGKGIPIGVSTMTEGIIYPHIIGNDIGCGMGLFKTGISLKKLKIDRIIKRLESFDEFACINIDDGLAEFKNMDLYNPEKLGTIGGGNHFAELQVVDRVTDQDQMNHFGIEKDAVYILVHSGSRGFGESILRNSIELHQGQNGFRTGTDEFKEYFTCHDKALEWARINRELIAFRLLKGISLKDSKEKILDITHNYLEEKNVGGKRCFIHRKGSVSTDNRLLIIPGSRGAHTYIVKPLRSGEDHLFSAAHGAGRKWQRILCKGKLGNKYDIETIRYSKFGSKVLCNDRNLLFEEAAESYKNIAQVIDTMVNYGLIEIIAMTKPLVTIKI
jgi:release factor H-coupled RctB family protein